MEILSYLAEVIKTRKEVGIAGLGTFFKKKSPGRYDAETHSFLPPSFILSFTDEVKEQMALADFVSRKRNISNDAANYYIEQFVAEIQKQLSEGQQADLGELGNLQLLSGILNFKPKDESNFGFDFYGLPNLKETTPAIEKPVADDISKSQNIPTVAQPIETTESAPPINISAYPEEQEVTEEQLILEDNNADLSDGFGDFEELHHEEKDIEEAEEVPVPFVETVAQPDPILNFPPPVRTPDVTPVPEIREETHNGMSTYLIVIIALAIILAILATIYYVKPELFKGFSNKTEQPLVQKDQVNTTQFKADSLALADSVNKSQAKTIVTDTLKDSSIVTPKAIPAIDTAIKYEIIAASLANQKEADNFLDQMKRNGIPAKIANMPGRRIKISIGSFTDEATANNELELLKKSTKIPGIYIYRIRHTKKPL